MELWIILLSITIFILLIFTFINFSIYKKKKKLLIETQNIFKQKKFEEIYKETEEIVSIIFSNMTSQNIVKEYVSSNDTLDTEKVRSFIKESIIDYKMFVNTERYKLYNQILNNRYDELIIRLVYNRIIEMETKVKSFNNRKK